MGEPTPPTSWKMGLLRLCCRCRTAAELRLASSAKMEWSGSPSCLAQMARRLSLSTGNHDAFSVSPPMLAADGEFTEREKSMMYLTVFETREY